MVIGAGPSGSMASRVLSFSGLKTLLIEGKKKIGKPVQCAEAISDRCLAASGVLKEGPHLINRINECSIMSPSGNELRFNSRGWCMDRPLFESMMAEMAVSSGATLRTGCRVTGINRAGEGFETYADGEKITSRSLVLACGPTSALPEQIGLPCNRQMMRGLNAKVRRVDRSDKLIFMVDRSYRGGYGWYFPRGEDVNVGFVAMTGVKKGLGGVLARLKIKDREISSYQGGVIPVGGPLVPFHVPGAILVGDAGGFSHPVSKGGIHGAILSGKEGALGIAELLSGDGNALMKSERRILDNPAFERANIYRARLLGSLSNSQLDSLTGITQGRPVREVGGARYLLKALTRPSLYPLIARSGLLLGGKLLWLLDSW